LKKGARVYVEGRMETRKWTDKVGALDLREAAP